MVTYEKKVTPEGKTEVLRLAFSDSEERIPFCYFALGTGNGADSNGEWEEVISSNYHRAKAITNFNGNTQQVEMSCVFDENNYDESTPVEITEIALCQESERKNGETIFAYCNVPPIEKTGNISLKYTMIISIE